MQRRVTWVYSFSTVWLYFFLRAKCDRCGTCCFAQYSHLIDWFGTPSESQLHEGHLTSKLKYKRFPSYLLCTFLLFSFHLLPSPMHPIRFSFCFFPGFLAIFMLLSSNSNIISFWDLEFLRPGPGWRAPGGGEGKIIWNVWKKIVNKNIEFFFCIRGINPPNRCRIQY